MIAQFYRAVIQHVIRKSRQNALYYPPKIFAAGSDRNAQSPAANYGAIAVKDIASTFKSADGLSFDLLDIR